MLQYTKILRRYLSCKEVDKQHSSETLPNLLSIIIATLSEQSPQLSTQHLWKESIFPNSVKYYEMLDEMQFLNTKLISLTIKKTL